MSSLFYYVTNMHIQDWINGLLHPPFEPVPAKTLGRWKYEHQPLRSGLNQHTSSGSSYRPRRGPRTARSGWDGRAVHSGARSEAGSLTMLVDRRTKAEHLLDPEAGSATFVRYRPHPTRQTGWLSLDIDMLCVKDTDEAQLRKRRRTGKVKPMETVFVTVSHRSRSRPIPPCRPCGMYF